MERATHPYWIKDFKGWEKSGEGRSQEQVRKGTHAQPTLVGELCGQLGCQECVVTALSSSHRARGVVSHPIMGNEEMRAWASVSGSLRVRHWGQPSSAFHSSIVQKE